MMRHISLLAVAALTVTGCATPSTDAAPIERGGSGECNADNVQDRIGQVATPELAAELLAATGARTLRWAPPRSAMTMDYRPDRLTVSYDDNMVIDRISCG